MATRVQVAASACLVASGLFMCGLGSALAFAEPGHGHSNGSAGEPNRDSQNDSDRRGDRDGDDSSSKPRPKETDSRESNLPESPQKETPPKEIPPEITPPISTPPTDITTKPPTTTRPTTTTETPPPSEPPGEEGGGGGGGGGFEPPRGRPEPPPAMRLPTPREVEPGGPPVPDPAVIDAGPPPVAAAGLPVDPITMPVIVSPSAGFGSGAPGGPSGPGLPGSPRGLPAEGPAGRERLPANIGSNAASSYRIGYTEYLRTAGLPQVAALAVPGVGGILVLTGAGGLVGYRQAKAGHAVRSGSARFMN